MDKRLIVANALSFFSMVIVYQAFLTIASPLSAIRLPFSLMELNLWFMFLSLLGVLIFAYSFQRTQSKNVTQLLHFSLVANGLSVLVLAAGLASKTANLFLYAGGFVFPVACGYLDGCLFYLLARHTMPQRQGLAIGLYIALTNGLLFLVQRLVESFTGAPLFLPWPLLLLALILIFFLLRPVPTEEDAQPVVLHTQVMNHLPLFCCIGVLLSLLIGLSSTLDFVKYEDYYRNWHAISRLFLAAGYLAAGWLADNYPVWLPVAALLAKVTVFAAYTFVLEGAPLWFTIFADAFFSPFIILFLIWMFFNVALRSSHPELWAGMGRAIERPFHVLGALAGEMLLQHEVSHGVMSLVYMGLLILAVALLYKVFLLYTEAWKHSVTEETAAAVKVEYAAETSAENYNGENSAGKDTGTKDSNEIAAASLKNISAKNTETVACEAAENFSEEMAAEDFSDIFTENDGETAATTKPFERADAKDVTQASALNFRKTGNEEKLMPVTPDRQNIDLSLDEKADKAVYNDSGPLHGDRLRKYQLRYRLTNRETEVLWEILQKHKISDIASNLYITIPTAKYHISNILQKTGAKNQRELRYLIQKEE